MLCFVIINDLSDDRHPYYFTKITSEQTTIIN